MLSARIFSDCAEPVFVPSRSETLSSPALNESILSLGMSLSSRYSESASTAAALTKSSSISELFTPERSFDSSSAAAVWHALRSALPSFPSGEAASISLALLSIS